MTDDQQRLDRILRPVAPPLVLDGVYSDDQHQRISEVIKGHGPWPTITAHHFDTVEELMATSNGGVPENLDITLDDIATAHFRGIFAEGSIPFFPELEDCYYNSRFLQLVRELLGGPLCPPDPDAVQPVRAAPQRAERPPRRGDLPGHTHRELSGVAPERDGPLRVVHRAPG